MLKERGAAHGVRPDDGLESLLFADETAPAERLSWSRLGILVVIVAALAAGGFVAVKRVVAGTAAAAPSWSVPYVDVTLTPSYQFQDPQSNPARDIALAFIVADPADGCAPSWGGAYSLQAADQTLELDRRISQLRASGGDIMVSLGGQANQELAVSCTDQAKLTAAYREIVERYNVDVLDLDVEGTAVADQASIDRRAQAIAAVQKERTSSGKTLAVWLTLPVTPTGLTADAVSLVKTTLSGGVVLKGVNVMTMDYGTSRPAGVGMLDASEQALEATATQIGDLYRSLGTPLNDAQTWAHVGATPMIGQNDVNGEVFTVDDAQGLAAYALDKGLGRVSTWSINRDTPCAAAFADVVIHSNTCSGVAQKPLAFAGVFTALPGRAPSAPKDDAIIVPTPTVVVDNPATSPYPIWRPNAQYPGTYKVVWHGQVYQAKWSNAGTDPSAPGGAPGTVPWALIGPVAATDTAPSPSPTATGVSAVWDSLVVYTKGERVLFNDLPYEARWTTKGDAPSTDYPIAADSPWKPLFTVPGEPLVP